jgi:hypothetical protein
MGAGIAVTSSRVHNPAPGHDLEGGSITIETRRAALTALVGLMTLALPAAFASSDPADAALVDVGTLAQCNAQETMCPDDDLEPREQIGIVAAARALRGPGERCAEVILKLAATLRRLLGMTSGRNSFEDPDRHRRGNLRFVGHRSGGCRRSARIRSWL